jgi:hypothetical protein
LAAWDLGSFSRTKPEDFPQLLDQVTCELKESLPEGSQSWGLSQKLINIFFRDSLYNKYLNTNYKISQYEKVLEIPLDSITAKNLKKSCEGLPAWKGVRNLEPGDSRCFQGAAEKIAKSNGLSRVHLDTFWWGQR